MPNPKKAAPDALLKAIVSKLMPWARESVAQRFVVAHPTYREFLAQETRLPSGVCVSRAEFKGPRVAVKRSGAPSGTGARWPDDGLEAQRVPTLLCVLDGRADWHVGEYTLHCEAGQFIVSPSGVPTADGTRAHLDPARGEAACCDLLWFTPWADWMNCSICHSRGGRHWKRPDEAVYIRSPRVNRYFEDIVQEIMSRQAGYEDVFAGLLPAFLTVVQRELELGHAVRWWPIEPIAVDSEESDAARDPIARARRYIREHLAEPLTIDQVARSVYLSRSHFAKTFHRESGGTFTQYLTRCRLDRAKELLCHTQWTIVAICRSIGITPGRLTQLFHRYEGQSPSEYRRARALPLREADNSAR